MSAMCKFIRKSNDCFLRKLINSKFKACFQSSCCHGNDRNLTFIT